MLKLSKFITSIALAVTVAGCSLMGSNDQTEYIPVKMEADGEWGLLGANGKPLFINEFKNPISNVVAGVFIARENKAYTIYKASATPTPLGSYEDLLSVGLPGEGKIVICTKDKAIVTITTEGERSFVLPEKVIVSQAYFRDGLLGVCDNTGKWGFVDEKGTQIIPCKYDGVSTFSDGFAVVASISDKKTTLSIINKKGEVVARVKNSVRLASNNPTFVGGRIPAVNTDDQYGFLSTDGNFKKSSGKVKGIGDVSNSRFIFKNADNKYGAMDYNGNILIQPRYDELLFVPGSDKYLSRINSIYSLLDKNGEKLKEFSEYSSMKTGMDKFPIIATPGTTYEILDSDGNLLSQETFAEVGTTHTTFATEYIFRTLEIESSVLQIIRESLTNMFNRFDVPQQSGDAGSDMFNVDTDLFKSMGLDLSDLATPEAIDQLPSFETLNSFVQQILATGSVNKNGQIMHFYKGDFYAGDTPYPVMIAFVQSGDGISKAIYKNLTNNVKITMDFTATDEGIILTGMDGKNPFKIVLSNGDDNSLAGDSYSGSTHLMVFVQPTTESF